MTDQVDVNARLDETIAIWHALIAHLDAAGQQLLRLLGQLLGEGLVAESDRILAIAGQLCMQFEEPDLFRRIFAVALDGCQIDPDDEIRFLQRERK
jgi:hypothetical protein